MPLMLQISTERSLITEFHPVPRGINPKAQLKSDLVSVNGAHAACGSRTSC